MSDILAGRYELLEVIGRGGMGVVYRARDLNLERTVAVKVLPAEYADDVTLVERFTREARAAARLSDPHIVAVFDSGRDGDLRYIVMECIGGQSLAQLLRSRGPLAVPEAVDIAAQIATALSAAHAAGIVHRDIKPANVMVDPTGNAKVLDFGIAHAAADHALTRTTMILGSAPYMAPEVALGRTADERSDIYSLGCVLYEMLTGRPPFTGDLPAAVTHQQATADPEPARSLRPEIPAAVEALLMQMLAKDPEERPQRAAGLVAALGDTLHGQPVTAPTRVRPASPPAIAPVATSPPLPSDRNRSRGAGWLVLLALAAALAVGIAVALAASSGSNRSPKTGTTAPTNPATSSTPTSTTTVTSTSRITTSSRSSTTSTTSASTPSTPSTKPTSTTSSTSQGPTTSAVP